MHAQENIEVLTGAHLRGFAGYKGNFTTEVTAGADNVIHLVEHGVVIMATGAREYTPTEYLYPEEDRVVTQVELSDRLEAQGAADLSSSGHDPVRRLPQ